MSTNYFVPAKGSDPQVVLKLSMLLLAHFEECQKVKPYLRKAWKTDLYERTCPGTRVGTMPCISSDFLKTDLEAATTSVTDSGLKSQQSAYKRMQKTVQEIYELRDKLSWIPCVGSVSE